MIVGSKNSMAHQPDSIRPSTPGKRSPLAATGNALLLVLGLLASPGAFSFDPDSELPIQVQADSARLDDRAGEARYTGNVIISQGATRLSADEVTLFREAGELARIHATGEPATYEQPEGEDGFSLNAEGRNIRYSREKGRVTFEKNAIIRHNADTFRGDIIHYDVEDRVVTAHGTDADSATGGRVEMTIQPRPRREQDQD